MDSTDILLGAVMGSPGALRFIVQPLLAILLGVRDGRLDAEAGKRPFLLSLLTAHEDRRALLKSGWASIAIPFLVAILVDMLLRFFVYLSIRPLASIVVGGLLVGLPYSLARGMSNRFIHARTAHRHV